MPNDLIARMHKNAPYTRLVFECLSIDRPAEFERDFEIQAAGSSLTAVCLEVPFGPRIWHVNIHAELMTSWPNSRVTTCRDCCMTFSGPQSFRRSCSPESRSVTRALKCIIFVRTVNSFIANSPRFVTHKWCRQIAECSNKLIPPNRFSLLACRTFPWKRFLTV